MSGPVDRRPPAPLASAAPSLASAPTRPVVLATHDVRREYRLGAETVRAVRGISLEVREGDWLSLVGPSGCGKSTMLNLLGAIDRPSAGRVEIRGRDTTTLSDREATALRLRDVGFVFQRFYLMPQLSAFENVELPMAEARVNATARRARVTELLDYVGLGPRAHHRPSELSGGEQQRVAIARALANQPAFLLADEPTGELDAATGAEVIRLLGQLNADGMTLVIVTHDETLARAGRRVVSLRDGQVVRDEAP